MHLDSLEKMNLAERANFLTEQERSRYQDEIRKLKKELFEKDGELEIQNLKNNELVKTTKELNNIISSLNEQSLKKKEKCLFI